METSIVSANSLTLKGTIGFQVEYVNGIGSEILESVAYRAY